MKSVHALSIVGGLLLTMVGGGCTQKYALQKEADDRLIASLREDNDMLREELEETMSELGTVQGMMSEKERQVADANRDRDDYKSRMDEALARAASSRPQGSEKLGEGITRNKLPGFDVLSVDSAVTFAPGEAKISTKGQATLREVARILKQDYRGRQLWIQGHTDDTPIKKSGFKSNLHLSVARSLSVIDFLSEQCGVPASQLICVGRGQHDPVVRGTTDVARSKNRRVEVVVATGD